ncbi:MAG: CBS domain-containing protein [Burkholderiales bacterium]|nr:CBS domain-containing protein [Burkholderiales bacterium]
MKVSQIMSSNPVAVGLDDPLSTVRDIFDHAGFHHLLVVDEGELIGVVSDRDLLRHISCNIGTNVYTPKDLDTLKKRVHQIVTRKPITLAEEASVEEAIDVFNTHRISCIPIVDAAGAAVGIVSWRDILKNFQRIIDEKLAAG